MRGLLKPPPSKNMLKTEPYQAYKRLSQANSCFAQADKGPFQGSMRFSQTDRIISWVLSNQFRNRTDLQGIL